MSQHTDTSKNTKAWAVSQHTDTSKNTKAWAMSQHTDTSKNIKAWAVSQHTDTSMNTKAWAVSQHTDTSMNTKAWAVSQHTDTSMNTRATLTCYALIIMWGLSSALKNSLNIRIHPPEREITHRKTACGCPGGGVDKTATHEIVSCHGTQLKKRGFFFLCVWIYITN